MGVGEILAGMNSFEAIRYVLNGIDLHPLQCVDIMKMLYSKRCIVTYDTGTGKTLLAAAFIKLLTNENPDRKFIMLVKKDQLIQTPDKLRSACQKSVLFSTADAKSIAGLLNAGLDSATVLLLTHDCLDNARIMNILFKKRSSFCGLIIDEAHELSNFNNAAAASVLDGMCRVFEYCIALTATPITTEVLQLAKLAHVIHPKKYSNYKKLCGMLEKGKFKIDDDPLFFINRGGDDFGGRRDYNGILEWVEPLPHQKEQAGGVHLMQLCKGDGAYRQVYKLVQVIQRYSGRRGLIYISQTEIKNWVLPFLDEAGIRYACINGSTAQAERQVIIKGFNEGGDYDVIITSVTTALDLDCEYVVFYEFTVMVKQMIGRAHRGLGSKTLDVIFIITNDTCEVDYFCSNILTISFVIRDIMHKDYREMEDVSRELEGVV